MSAYPQVVRDSFDMGTAAQTALIANQTGKPWLTVWNVGSGEIAIGAATQLVGALKSRSFYVADDDPIQALFTWGQFRAIGTQPGQKVRKIPYALADFPLAGVDEADLYSTPATLVFGSTPGNSITTITPNPGEVFTHLDVAYSQAQSAGVQQETVSANYGTAISTFLLIPPTGASRQVLRVDGPVSLAINNGSLLASCDWQVFGVANVVR